MKKNTKKKNTRTKKQVKKKQKKTKKQKKNKQKKNEKEEKAEKRDGKGKTLKKKLKCTRGDRTTCHRHVNETRHSGHSEFLEASPTDQCENNRQKIIARKTIHSQTQGYCVCVCQGAAFVCLSVFCLFIYVSVCMSLQSR